jgi:DNA polymerase-3 subunit delta'
VGAIDSNLLEQHNTQMEEILAVIDTGLEDRFDYAAQLASEFGQEREKVQDKLALWLDWWHDLLLVKCSLIDIVTNIDRLDVLKRTADSLNLTQTKETIESIVLAGEQLKLNANARLTLESLMLGLPVIASKPGLAKQNTDSKLSNKISLLSRGEL